mmetsp:Transcript_27678/g.64914  ORF Transcript_27678/g.64914 Transcript_27678/m.64914 type:complete len:240 (-) Transcript_27678:263-982(-)
MTSPLKTAGGLSSSSMISSTLLLDLESVKLATQTSATKSRLTSPAFKVSSPEILSAPVGGLAFSPPGLTMVQLRPESLRYFSAMIFSSKTFPNALVMTNPGLFSWPQFLPLVRMDDTMTTFFTPAFLAASTSLQVPTLSTSCAAWFIFSGFPGMNPVAITRLSAPARAVAISSTESFTTSRCAKVTADVSTEATFWTIAPRTTVEDSERAWAALSTLRTPPTTSRFPEAASRSRTRRPV